MIILFKPDGGSLDVNRLISIRNLILFWRMRDCRAIIQCQGLKGCFCNFRS